MAEHQRLILEPLQTLPMHAIDLQNKNAFQAGGPNWYIAGNLSNQPTASDHTNLVTRMKHGDLELELDFLMLKGSNSGIYLQGRYEVQLLGSG